MDCSLPASSVHVILQARILKKWSGLPFSSPGFLPQPGIQPGFPALHADSLTGKHLFFNIYLMGKTEKAKATHSSTLAWNIPQEPGRLWSMGSRRVRHDWATSLSLFTFMQWRRKWQPTRVLACRIPGTAEPGGLPSMGSHRVGHD